MRSVDHGAQWTSRVSPRTKLVATLMAIALLIPAAAATPAPADAATDYILMSRSALMSRPVSGTRWHNLKAVADASLGSPNLCDQNSRHHLRTLAAALVYARTGVATYGAKARGGVIAALKTLRVGCDNATLALGRQLTAYVLAADFADMVGTPDTTFRAFLTTIRRRFVGGHGVWTSLYLTHLRSATNWGAYAGAARIAASLYLGDTADVAAASKVTRGFLGDRAAYKFWDRLSYAAKTWSCAPTNYTPVNGYCRKGGLIVDGAVVADISRGGSRRWPPGDTGVQYQLDSIQGLGLQVELLYQNGYSGAWHWQNDALRRMANIVTRSKKSGGMGWNETQASRQMPWLLDRRLGMSIPRAYSPMGRAIGFADWLWG
jgi:hypothetical protein